MLTQGGRLAGSSSVFTTGCKRAATALAMRENARAFGARNACVAGTQNDDQKGLDFALEPVSRSKIGRFGT
jgi:hypothetical protein